MLFPDPIEYVTIEEIARQQRVQSRKIFETAGIGTIPLFVSVPNELCAYRIDVQKNDLASRTQLFVNPGYDLYQPVLLRLKLTDCAKLATEASVEATDFPYAVCHVGGNIDPAMSEDRKSDSAQSFTTVQIPPNMEIFPTQLDSAQVCWRLFQPNTKDLSKLRPLVVTAAMVVTRSDYLGHIATLRKTGSRIQAGKTTAGYRERHERNRDLLTEVAEEVAARNESECRAFREWADLVYELRDLPSCERLRQAKKTFSRSWVEKTLRARYEFIQGKPVKKFTTSK